jgi:hypothetical protein
VKVGPQLKFCFFLTLPLNLAGYHFKLFISSDPPVPDSQFKWKKKIEGWSHCLLKLLYDSILEFVITGCLQYLWMLMLIVSIALLCAWLYFQTLTSILMRALCLLLSMGRSLS